jgi:hypothetical protein
VIEAAVHWKRRPSIRASQRLQRAVAQMEPLTAPPAQEMTDA